MRCDDATVVREARRILSEHRTLGNRVESLLFTCDCGVLTIEGELPTYYEKQLLQESLMQLAGVTIDNRASVRS